MASAIYFIGGASASGKSVVARALAAEAQWPIVELDEFYDILDSAFEDHTNLEKATDKIALQVVVQLLAVNAACLVEGGWIDPAPAKKLKDRSQGQFYPVYCGYPNGTVEQRLTMIKREKAHWLAERSKKTARAYLESQIKHSRWYQRQCDQYGLPFFDFSDISVGVAALSANYTDWLRSVGTHAKATASQAIL